MNWLKEKTIIQFFTRKGGKLTEDGYWISLPSKHQTIYLNLYRQDSLKRNKKEPSLEVHGPRWKYMGNVHIVSYWGWPRSVEELQRIWNEIRHTYGELSGITWKEQAEVNWEIARRKKEKRQMYNLDRQVERLRRKK